LRYKKVSEEPDFAIFSHRSAATLFKNRFARTFRSHFSPAKPKFKHALTCKTNIAEKSQRRATESPAAVPKKPSKTNQATF